MSVSISTCWKCRGRIHSIGHCWFHKLDGLAFSSIGGDHMASPFPPDESSVGDDPRPPTDGVPPEDSANRGDATT